jgi:hypothetical protein
MAIAAWATVGSLTAVMANVDWATVIVAMATVAWAIVVSLTAVMATVD